VPNVPSLAEPTSPTTGFQRKIRALGFCWLAYSALLVAFLITVAYQLRFAPAATSTADYIAELLIFLNWLHALLGIAAAIGLLNFQGWGRVLAIISSVLAVPLTFPIGTALGIWGLALLLKKENAAAYKALSSTGA
jgi:hypothetical protein